MIIKVIDNQGNPIEDVKLTVVRGEKLQGQSAGVGATTNKDGLTKEFHIPGAGPVTIGAIHMDYIYKTQHSHTKRKEVIIQLEREPNIDVPVYDNPFKVVARRIKSFFSR